MARISHILRLLVLITLLAAVVVLAMLWLTGYFRNKVAPTATVMASARPVGNTPLVEAKLISVPVIESAVGTIRPMFEAGIASKILERVVEVNLQAGQSVHKGDVLVRLEDASLKSKLQQAQASLSAAEAAHAEATIELTAIEQAFSRTAATQMELDRARTAERSTAADRQRFAQQVEEAKTALDFSVIRAPMDGLIIDKKVNVGDTVMPGQIVATMYDRMQLIASVRESLVGRLTKGQTIDVRLEAMGKTCQGTVSEIVPEAQAASRYFWVKVTGPCQSGIFPGMFGRLMIPLTPEQVLVIPQSAVRKIGQLDVVDVAEGDQLRRRGVQLGTLYDDNIQVLSGLRAGERVALRSEGR